MENLVTKSLDLSKTFLNILVMHFYVVYEYSLQKDVNLVHGTGAVDLFNINIFLSVACKTNLRALPCC